MLLVIRILVFGVILSSLVGCAIDNRPLDQSTLKRIEKLEQQVAQAADKQAIHDVLNRYARALDWLDADRLDRVFFDDAEIDDGFFEGTGKQFKPIVMQIEKDLGRRWHHSSQVSIDLKDDSANVESYGVSFMSSDKEAIDGTQMGKYLGFFQDRFEKRGGHWRIAYRKYIMFSTIMLEETPLDGDLSMFYKIGNASMGSPLFRDIGKKILKFITLNEVHH